ncbi:MAG TPA: hypothetical protein VFT74_15600 [Isosphaeraceae bacterium]|nr:hypothetical protein [Isosphaeraceae bacterium]
MRKALRFGLLVAGGSRPVGKPLISPDGRHEAQTEISGNEAGPTRCCCVRVKFREIDTGHEMTFQTGASDYQKWAITWSPSGSLVLYSSDIGICAHDLKDGKVVERSADDAESQIARGAYQKKFGKKVPA